jgi:hypothetical protein
MANTTFSGPVRSLNGFEGDFNGNIAGTGTVTHSETAFIDTTSTATAAQVATGYILAGGLGPGAITITMPTGADLGAALNAARGTVFDLYVQNTGFGSVIAVNTNAILSSAAADTPGSFGDLTIAAGATGLARFTLMFTSATAYVFTRTA